MSIGIRILQTEIAINISLCYKYVISAMFINQQGVGWSSPNSLEWRAWKSNTDIVDSSPAVTL